MNPASMAGMTGDDDDELTPPQAASMLPSGSLPMMAMPPMPMPQTNPFMAMGSGALAASMGSLANPYLQQQQTQQQSLAAQQNANMRTAGYLQQNQLAAQAQQLRAQAMQQQMKNQQEIRELKKEELNVKIAQGLLDGDENAQQVGSQYLSNVYSKKLGIPISPDNVRQYKVNLTEGERDGIHGTLLARLPNLRKGGHAPEEIAAAVDHVRGMWPKLPPKFLFDQVEILKSPAASTVAGIKEIKDPALAASEMRGKFVKAFLEENPALKGDAQVYQLADAYFKANTKHPMLAGGRNIHTADGPEDQILKDRAIAWAFEEKARLDSFIKGENPQELAGKLKIMEEEIRTGKRAPNDPEYRGTLTQLDRLKTVTPPPFSGFGGAGTMFSPVVPQQTSTTGPLAQPGEPRLFKEPILPTEAAGSIGVPFGTTVKEGARVSQESGRPPLLASQRTQLDSLSASVSLLESVEKDITGLNKIVGPMDRFKGSAQRFWDITMQNNPEAAAAVSRAEGGLAKIARSLGEVGTLAEGDIVRARNLWPVLRPTVEFVGPFGGVLPKPTLPDTDAVVKAKIAGLKELFNEIKNRTGLPAGGRAFTGDPYQAIISSRPQPASSPAPAQAPKAGAKGTAEQRLRDAGYTEEQIQEWKKARGR